MFSTRTRSAEKRRTGDGQSDVRTVARRFGALNVLAGLLGFANPAVEGDGDRGPIAVTPGLFLGVIAVNAGHDLFHLPVGALGLRASRDAGSSRRYQGFSAALFGLFSAVVWRRWGFDREIHTIGGVAINGWANLGHTLRSAYSFLAAIRADPRG